MMPGGFGSDEYQRAIRSAMRASWYGAHLLAIYVALIAVSLLAGFLAVRFSESSFLQGMFVEICAGTAIFLALPQMINLHSRFQRVVPILTLGAALIAGIAGTRASGVAQAFFIEACGALLLLVALELTVRRWLTDILKVLSGEDEDEDEA